MALMSGTKPICHQMHPRAYTKSFLTYVKNMTKLSLLLSVLPVFDYICHPAWSQSLDKYLRGSLPQKTGRFIYVRNVLESENGDILFSFVVSPKYKDLVIFSTSRKKMIGTFSENADSDLYIDKVFANYDVIPPTILSQAYVSGNRKTILGPSKVKVSGGSFLQWSGPIRSVGCYPILGDRYEIVDVDGAIMAAKSLVVFSQHGRLFYPGSECLDQNDMPFPKFTARFATVPLTIFVTKDKIIFIDQAGTYISTDLNLSCPESGSILMILNYTTLEEIFSRSNNSKEMDNALYTYFRRK